MKVDLFFFLACALVLAMHLQIARPDLFAMDRLVHRVLAGVSTDAMAERANEP
jgi:hypothetical protein